MRRRILSALTGFVLAFSSLLFFTGTAAAVDGWVARESPNGLAYGEAYLNFTSAHYVAINNIYLNDRCPGDGTRARMEFYVRYTGSTNFVKVGEREDTGGCGSEPYQGSTHWGPTTREINDFGIKVCSAGGCSGIEWRDNGHN